MVESRLHKLLLNAIAAYKKILSSCKIGPEENALRILLHEFEMSEDEYREITSLTYIAYRHYEDWATPDDFEDFDDAKEAVKFARNHKWDEVICYQTDEVIWHKKEK